jgi:hypothetical protein
MPSSQTNSHPSHRNASYACAWTSEAAAGLQSLTLDLAGGVVHDTESVHVDLHAGPVGVLTLPVATPARGSFVF